MHVLISKNRLPTWLWLCAPVLLLTVLCSVVVSAAPIDTPIVRSLFWFRFVAGKDVREACAAGAPDHFRLVYNAVYREQVRAYDIQTRPDGSGYMTVRVFGPAVINSVEIAEPGDVLGPWRGRKAKRELTQAQVSELVKAIGDSGGFAFPAKRFEVPSNDFYWAVATCFKGKFTSTAYHYPTDGFKNVHFDKPLFALDTTGVPVNSVRELTPSALRGDQTQVWRLRVGPSGIEY